MLSNHINRFSNSYFNKIKDELTNINSSIERLDYKDLNQVLISVKPKNNTDLIEYYYLLAKLAVINFDLSFFEKNRFSEKNLIVTNIGFSIWKANYLLIKNKLYESKQILEDISKKNLETDLMLLLDYFYVKILLTYENKNFSEIIKTYENNKELINSLEDHDFSTLGIYYRVLISYIILGKNELAKELIDKGLVLSEKYSKNYFYARFIGIKGYFLRSRKNVRSGYDYYQKALEIAKIYKFESEIAFHNKMLSSFEIDLGLYQMAFDHSKEAININEKIGNKLELKNIYLNHGIILLKLSKYELAKESYLKALKFFIETKDYQSILQVYNSLGIISHDQGNFDKALQNYQKAHEISIKNNLISNRLYTLNNIAMIYKHKAEYEKAIDMIKKAIIVYENNVEKLRFNVNLLYLNLIDLNIYQGNYLESLTISNEIVDLESLNTEELGYLFFMKSKANYNMGEIDEAQKSAEKSITYLEKTESPFNIAVGLENIAKIQYILDKKIDSINSLKSALKIIKNNKIHGDLYQDVKIELIEVLVNNYEFEEAKLNIESFKSILKENNIKISNYRENQLIFIELLQKNIESTLTEEEILKYYEKIKTKNYFILRMKTLSLLIDYYISDYNLEKALKLIDEGIVLASEKKNLILEIEIKLLKALLLSKQGKVKESKLLCDNINHELKENKIVSYQTRLAETIEKIEDHEKYNIALLAVEESQKKLEDPERDNILKEEVQNYLKLIMRFVKEKEVSLS